MEYKKIDNEFINTKEKINEINNMIDAERQKIKKIDVMQQDAVTLNKNLNKCIALLSKSIKGSTSQNRFNDMYDACRTTYVNLTSSLDEIALASIKTINTLSKQKDNIIKEDKKNRGVDNASSSS